jgi:TPR repeat protein
MNDYQRREPSISRLGKFFFVLLGVLAVSGAACTSPEQTTEEAIAAGLAELRAQAEQGDAEAQYNLGFMYEKGQGVPQDDTEAVRWLRLAAEQGDVQAQSNLGGMYSHGRGVEQDILQAHMWSNLAASGQSGEERKRAVDARDALEKLMTPAQLAEAQRLAREWEAAHPRD